MEENEKEKITVEIGKENINNDPINNTENNSTGNNNTGNNNVSVERKGFNLTSMILGIIAIAFSLTPYSFYVTLPSAIVAIIFGIAGRKDSGRGMGIAGIVLGILSLIISIIIFVIAVWMIAAMFSAYT